MSQAAAKPCCLGSSASFHWENIFLSSFESSKGLFEELNSHIPLVPLCKLEKGMGKPDQAGTGPSCTTQGGPAQGSDVQLCAGKFSFLPHAEEHWGLWDHGTVLTPTSPPGHPETRSPRKTPRKTSTKTQTRRWWSLCPFVCYPLAISH